jgi:hypothetical protein
MRKYKGVITRILQAVALGMAAASIVLGILNASSAETGVAMLGIGLFALALVSLQEAGASSSK